MDPRVSMITLGVKDLERSQKFYRDGLGFPTTSKVGDGVIFFKTQGVCLALFPYASLAEDISPEFQVPKPKFGGISLAHNVRTKEEVVQILEQAKKAGAKIEKPAQDTFWGGYSGYFSDLDGYVWEVAYGAFEIASDGSLIVT